MTTPEMMSPEEAQEITDRIAQATGPVWIPLLQVFSGQGWRALGYKTWESYVSERFHMKRARSYQILDQGRINVQVMAAIREARGESTFVDIAEGYTRKLKPVLSEALAHLENVLQLHGVRPNDAVDDMISKFATNSPGVTKPKVGRPKIEIRMAPPPDPATVAQLLIDAFHPDWIALLTAHLDNPAPTNNSSTVVDITDVPQPEPPPQKQLSTHVGVLHTDRALEFRETLNNYIDYDWKADENGIFTCQTLTLTQEGELITAYNTLKWDEGAWVVEQQENDKQTHFGILSEIKKKDAEGAKKKSQHVPWLRSFDHYGQ